MHGLNLSQKYLELKKSNRNYSAPLSDTLPRDHAKPSESNPTEPNEPCRVGTEGTCDCGRVLAEQSERVGECRQQIEIPEPKAGVTEYRQIVVKCVCGLLHNS